MWKLRFCHTDKYSLQIQLILFEKKLRFTLWFEWNTKAKQSIDFQPGGKRSYQHVLIVLCL
jgi:hypothetical protein